MNKIMEDIPMVHSGWPMEEKQCICLEDNKMTQALCPVHNPQPMKIDEKIGQILATDCRTPKGCLLDHGQTIKELKSLFAELMREVIKNENY